MEGLDFKMARVDYIRQVLLKRIQDEYPDGWVGLKHDLKWLWKYYCDLYKFCSLVNRECQKRGDAVIELYGKDWYMCASLCDADFIQVPIWFAAVGWLTLDDQKWTDNAYDWEFPEDLSYGLVLQYPEPILTACSWLAGLTEETFTHDIEVTAQEHALRQIKEIDDLPLTEQEILDMVFKP